MSESIEGRALCDSGGGKAEEQLSRIDNMIVFGELGWVIDAERPQRDENMTYSIFYGVEKVMGTQGFKEELVQIGSGGMDRMIATCANGKRHAAEV